jgi:hypothetical protein
LADPAQVRIVMQTSLRSSPADGNLIPGQLGIVLVDNLSLKNGSNADVLAPVNFESGTTGAWTTSALNGAYTPTGNVPSAIRDFPPPATSVALRTGVDPVQRVLPVDLLLSPATRWPTAPMRG